MYRRRPHRQPPSLPPPPPRVGQHKPGAQAQSASAGSLPSKTCREQLPAASNCLWWRRARRGTAGGVRRNRSGHNGGACSPWAAVDGEQARQPSPIPFRKCPAFLSVRQIERRPRQWHPTVANMPRPSMAAHLSTAQATMNTIQTSWIFLILSVCDHRMVRASSLTSADPEIGTLTTLTNVQNSLFVPSLGRFLNRNPTYNLTRHQKNTTDPGDTPPKPEPNPRPPPVKRTNTGNATIGSALEPDEPRYAIVPDGVSLEGWSTTDKQELNDHVRHLLHSRKARFRRAMKGFGQYASRRKRLPEFPNHSNVNLSPWLLRHALRNSHHDFRLDLGVVLDWLD